MCDYYNNILLSYFNSVMRTIIIRYKTIYVKKKITSQNGFRKKSYYTGQNDYRLILYNINLKPLFCNTITRIIILPCII